MAEHDCSYRHRLEAVCESLVEARSRVMGLHERIARLEDLLSSARDVADSRRTHNDELAQMLLATLPHLPSGTLRIQVRELLRLQEDAP